MARYQPTDEKRPTTTAETPLSKAIQFIREGNARFEKLNEKLAILVSNTESKMGIGNADGDPAKEAEAPAGSTLMSACSEYETNLARLEARIAQLQKLL